MAKTSSIEKNNRRRKLAKKYAGKRSRLKAIAATRTGRRERFEATIKLAGAAAHGSAVRIRNRCEVTGRARGYYRQTEDEPHRDAGIRRQG